MATMHDPLIDLAWLDLPLRWVKRTPGHKLIPVLCKVDTAGRFVIYTESPRLFVHEVGHLLAATEEELTLPNLGMTTHPPRGDPNTLALGHGRDAERECWARHWEDVLGGWAWSWQHLVTSASKILHEVFAGHLAYPPRWHPAYPYVLPTWLRRELDAAAYCGPEEDWLTPLQASVAAHWCRLLKRPDLTPPSREEALMEAGRKRRMLQKIAEAGKKRQRPRQLQSQEGQKAAEGSHLSYP